MLLRETNRLYTAPFNETPTFLLANILSGQSVLPQAQTTDIYLTAHGIALTVVYLWGLITRPHPQLFRMGIDSFTVLLLYVGGIAGLILVSNS